MPLESALPDDERSGRGKREWSHSPVGHLGQKSSLNRTERDSLPRAQINLQDSGPPWTELGLFSWPMTGKTAPL